MKPDSDKRVPPDPAPLPPVEPAAGDCCGSGCVRCVFDLYDDARQRYLEELAAWQVRQTEKGSGSGVV